LTSRSARTFDDDLLDPGDLAPAVLCARCGNADCAGCAPAKGEAPGSPPWERSDLGFWKRLWWTARDTTLSAETFFTGLSRGTVTPALTFAITSEVLAIGSFGIALTASASGLSLLTPLPLWERLGEARFALLALGAFVIIGTLSVLMVLLHVLWGLSLELGMRLQGARPRGIHCLRYALYSCGWDLLTSPFGLVIACIASGLGKGVNAVRAAANVPRGATRAYLSTAPELDEGSATRALWTAAALTGLVVIAGALGVAALAVDALLYR
jgi:hypothetical protein